jgi:hypothetical protein
MCIRLFLLLIFSLVVFNLSYAQFSNQSEQSKRRFAIAESVIGGTAIVTSVPVLVIASVYAASDESGNDALATPIIAAFIALGGVFFLMEGVETLIIMRSRNNSAQTLTISPEILDVTLYDGPAVKNTGGFGLGLTYRF